MTKSGVETIGAEEKPSSTGIDGGTSNGTGSVGTWSGDWSETGAGMNDDAGAGGTRGHNGVERSQRKNMTYYDGARLKKTATSGNGRKEITSTNARIAHPKSTVTNPLGIFHDRHKTCCEIGAGGWSRFDAQDPFAEEIGAEYESGVENEIYSAEEKQTAAPTWFPDTGNSAKFLQAESESPAGADAVVGTEATEQPAGGAELSGGHPALGPRGPSEACPCRGRRTKLFLIKRHGLLPSLK